MHDGQKPERSIEEHINIIDSYFEGSSMGKIAKKLGRSAATIHAQIHSHDESIARAL